MGMSPLKLFVPLFFFVAFCSGAVELDFSGLSVQPVKENAPASSGLTAVYVLPSVQGVSVSFTSASASTVTWQRFSALGAAYAEPVPAAQTGGVSTLANLEPNMGYVVTDGDKPYYFWIVDYSTAPFEIRDVALSSQSDCSTTWLDIDGSAPALTYYGITGVPQHLNREVTLSFSTLEFDSESFTYRQVTHVDTLEQMSDRVYCDPPLCQTDFTIAGDKYSVLWGEPHFATSSVYDPTAVALETSATQVARDVDNEVKDEVALGGSGPVDIEFKAAVTDAAVFHRWELARDPEFNQVYMQRDELEFTQSFREQGTFYVRLTVANDAGMCQAESQVYEVFIGESSLKCPNAFSPGASEGVNDEWKVSYKSIVKFDCRIFDRNGRQLAHFTDPSQGWNGKIGSKTVPTGVYFYVIRAEGTDGKKYKLSGDINVVGFKKGTTTNVDE